MLKKTNCFTADNKTNVSYIVSHKNVALHVFDVTLQCC